MRFCSAAVGLASAAAIEERLNAAMPASVTVHDGPELVR